LSGTAELILKVSFESLYLLKLLLGIRTTRRDVTLTIFHDLANWPEEQGIKQEGKENHLNRHKRKSGIEVKETSLRNSCFSEQKPGHGRVRWGKSNRSKCGYSEDHRGKTSL
jgi:hypothetical protein